VKGTSAAFILLPDILIVYKDQWTLSNPSNPSVMGEAKSKAEHERFMLAKIESLK
jgi:hypothetical protein